MINNQLEKHIQSWMEMFDKVLDDVIKDSWVKEKFKEFQQKCNEDFLKLKNPALITILRKLFKIIPARQLWWLWDLFLPRSRVNLTLTEMFLLHTNWINLLINKSARTKIEFRNKVDDNKNKISFIHIWSWIVNRMFSAFSKKQLQSDNVVKAKKWMEDMIADLVQNKEIILTTVEENWVKEVSYNITPDKWDILKFPVHIDYSNILWIDYESLMKEYTNLKKLIDDIYSKITQEEWLTKTENVQNEIAKRLQQNLLITYYSYKDWNGFWKLSDEFRKKQKRIPPVSIFMDRRYLISWKAFFHDKSQEVLNYQRSGQIPSIFNISSLEAIKEKQHIIILRDKSTSTDFRHAYKVLDVTTARVEAVLNEILWDKVDIKIVDFSDFILNIQNNINWFSLPNWWTNTDFALKMAVDLLYLLKKWVYNQEEFEKYCRYAYSNYSYKKDWGKNWLEFCTRLANDNTDSMDLLASSQELTQEKIDEIGRFRSILPDELDKWFFSWAHIVLLTDWLPNDQDALWKVCPLVKNLWIRFSQIVAWFKFDDPLNDPKTLIQSSILNMLWRSNLKNMQQYQRFFEKTAQLAGWQNFTCWVDEDIAWALMSITDLSIWLDFLLNF